MRRNALRLSLRNIRRAACQTSPPAWAAGSLRSVGRTVLWLQTTRACWRRKSNPAPVPKGASPVESSLLRRPVCRAVDTDHDDSLIIKGFHARRMLRHCLEKRIHHRRRRFPARFRDDLLNAPSSEQLSLSVSCVQDSVAEEHEHVARLGPELQFFVFGLIEQSEGQSRCLNDFGLLSTQADGAGKS